MKSRINVYMVEENSNQGEKESELPRKRTYIDHKLDHRYSMPYSVLLLNMFANCSTFRKDCGAELKLHASKDGLLLIVQTFCDKHNHPISRV